MNEEQLLALEDDTAKVFLSYSRRDRENAQRIADVLRERHFGVFRDTDDILPTEEWKGRLEQLIAEADTIVFLLSPNSAASEVCAWEVDHATSLNKRIAPIVIEEVDTALIPPKLARLNFIFCTARDRFQDAVDSLVSALGTDIEWIREHTRLAGLAARWSGAGQPGRLLLRGQDIVDAETWRDQHPADAPAVTPLQAAFIAHSRQAAARRQRLIVVLSIVGALVATGLAGFAFMQREAAIVNEQRALENERRAVESQALAERQRDQAQTNQSLLLTSFAEDELRKGFPVEAALLALEALPDARSSDPGVVARPLVEAPLEVLRRAYRRVREQRVLYSHVGGVAHVAVSADGKRIASVSVTRPEPEVGAVALAEGELIVYDLEQEKLLRRVLSRALRNRASAPSFDAAGRHVALAGLDGKAYVYAVDDDTAPGVVDSGAQSIEHALLSPDSETVYISTSDDRLLAVAADTGAVRFERPGGRVVLSPDGMRLAATHRDTVLLYDAGSGAALGESGPVRGPMSGPRWLRFSANGQRIAASSEHVAWVVDGHTARMLGKAPARKQSVSAVRLSADGSLLAVAGADRRAVIYDLTSRKAIADYRAHRAWLFDLDLSPDRSLAVSGAYDGTVQVWRPGEKQPLARLYGHVGPVKRALLQNDDTAVITAGEDGTVRRWRLPPGLGAESLVNEFAGDPLLSDDGRVLALSRSGLFDFEQGKTIRRLGGERQSPLLLAFTHDGEALLGQPVDPDTGNKPQVCVYALRSAAALACFGDADTVNIFEASVDPSGRTLAVLMAKEGPDVIATYDARSGEALGRIEFDEYARAPDVRLSLREPVVSADGESVFVRNQDAVMIYDRTLTVQQGRIELGLPGARLVYPHDQDLLLALNATDAELWDLPGQKRLATYALRNKTTSKPVVSPSGRYLASIDPSGELSLRLLHTGALLKRFGDADKAALEKPVFSADERYLLATREFTVLLWDTQSGQLLDSIRSGAPVPYPSIFAKAVSRDGQSVITWSWSGPQRWPLLRSAQSIVEHVQANVPRCLSRAQRRRRRLPETPPRWCLTGPGLEQQLDDTKWHPLWPFSAESER